MSGGRGSTVANGAERAFCENSEELQRACLRSVSKAIGSGNPANVLNDNGLKSMAIPLDFVALLTMQYLQISQSLTASFSNRGFA